MDTRLRGMTTVLAQDEAAKMSTTAAAKCFLTMLPAELLAVIAEASECNAGSMRALACCHSLVSSLRAAPPLLALKAPTAADALRIESSGMWRIQSLTLFGKLLERESFGVRSNTWDMFSITASARGGEEPGLHDMQMSACADSSVLANSTDLGQLANCVWLTDISIDGMDLSEGALSCLAEVTRLETLSLRQLKISSAAPLALYSRLSSLELSSCWRLTDVSSLVSCPNLRRLKLHHFKGTRLPACPQLRSVSVCESPTVSDLWGLTACRRLECLYFVVCHGVKDISPLADCFALREVCTPFQLLLPCSVFGIVDPAS